MERLKPVIICLTEQGFKTAQKIADIEAGTQIHGLKSRVETTIVFEDTLQHILDLYQDGRAIIGICSSAILIRALGSKLESKQEGAFVIAVSEDGKHIVPLLGAHHGGNAFAQMLADELDGAVAITTAGDNRFGVALDDPPGGWVLDNPQDAKPVMGRLLAGEAAVIDPELSFLQGSGLDPVPGSALKLLASERASLTGSEQELIYRPRRYSIGVGCERGTSSEEVISLIEASLKEIDLSPRSIAGLYSIDLKADETALHAAAEHLNVPLRFFTAERLEKEAPRLLNPSTVVFAEVGCHGVAEGAALAAVGEAGSLAAPKRKSTRATCAIGAAAEPFSGESKGRAQGTLYIVGIGPGQTEWRTREAEVALRSSSSWVGYSLYLDIISSLQTDQARIDYPLGAETDRVRDALERAGTGETVSLVCSGDGGIYAMGALAFELLDPNNSDAKLSDAAQRVEVVNVPGISALQAASARVGALLGHDFCTISLSDLLTPWEAIEKRLHAAGSGDFVVAFYNPVSKRRRTQLAEARRILLTYRPAHTPVLLASNLGRPGEALKWRSLQTLDVDEVDMLTIVLVGSSESRSFVRASGEQVGYTPRGYKKKYGGEGDQ